MSDDSFTEVSSESWISRIGGAIKGIFVGLLFFLAAFPLLFWNEGRAIKTAKGLDEGADAVIEVAADRVASENEGKLVHVTGRADSEGQLIDQEFQVAVEGIKLKRNVEMYQWKETSSTEKRKKLGGGQETVRTYGYLKEWSSSTQDSSQFKRPSKHRNPIQMPFRQRIEEADQISLGAFELNAAQRGRLGQWRKVPLPGDHPLPSDLAGDAQIVDGLIYIGASPARPKIGDVRISFEAVYPHDISLVAAQQGNSFAPYQTQAGGEIDLLKPGVISAEQMFQVAHGENNLTTWLIRFGGFLLMAIGLGMVLKPLSVIADVVPFIGNLIEAGTGLVAGLTAAILSLITIAIAWLFFRPLLAIGLIAAGGFLVFGVAKLTKKGKAKRTAALAAE